MSVTLRLAPALLAVGLTFSSSAGYSAAGCLPHAVTPALLEIAQFGELSPNEYILLAEEPCTSDCGTDVSAAITSGDMPWPTYLPVVAAPDEVAAWHVEIFERVSQIRQDGEADYYCKL